MKTISDVDFQSAVERQYHGKYKYPDLDNARTIAQKIKVICPEHGVFHVRVIDHMHGKECPVCTLKKPDRRLTVSKFLDLAVKKYGDLVYDYDELFGYRDRIPEKKFLMRCVKHSTKFHQTPREHLFQASGCPDCRKQAQKRQTSYSLRDHIKKLLQAHLGKKVVHESWSFPGIGFVYAFYIPEAKLVIDIFNDVDSLDTKLLYLRKSVVRSNDCGLITFYNKMDLNDQKRFSEFFALLKAIKNGKLSSTFEWGFF